MRQLVPHLYDPLRGCVCGLVGHVGLTSMLPRLERLKAIRGGNVNISVQRVEFFMIDGKEQRAGL